jgi:hypothetical protein
MLNILNHYYKRTHHKPVQILASLNTIYFYVINKLGHERFFLKYEVFFFNIARTEYYLLLLHFVGESLLLSQGPLIKANFSTYFGNDDTFWVGIKCININT